MEKEQREYFEALRAVFPFGNKFIERSLVIGAQPVPSWAIVPEQFVIPPVIPKVQGTAREV